jgi:Zn-finger nucleic acid-binding protein
MLARIYQCPSCGAATSEHARLCAYCRAPVATVRCAGCFHMNVPDAAHCSGCGLEVGLEPVGTLGSLTCPTCHEPLQTFPEEGGALYDCGVCGGQFVDHVFLHVLVDRADRARTAGPTSRREVPAERVHYLPCPVCSALMNRKNFGEMSGVILDVCKKHGAWLHPGDLPRVLAFVSSGGLDRERERHLRRLEEEAQKLRTAAASKPAGLMFPEDANVPGAGGAHTAAKLAKVVLDLLFG